MRFVPFGLMTFNIGVSGWDFVDQLADDFLLFRSNVLLDKLLGYFGMLASRAVAGFAACTPRCVIVASLNPVGVGQETKSDRRETCGNRGGRRPVRGTGVTNFL